MICIFNIFFYNQNKYYSNSPSAHIAKERSEDKNKNKKNRVKCKVDGFAI